MKKKRKAVFTRKKRKKIGEINLKGSPAETILTCGGLKKLKKPSKKIVAEAQRLYEQGKRNYRDFKDRPPVSKEGNQMDDMLFYGWMIARAQDVGAMINTRKAAGLDKDERGLSKQVRHLDLAHGLTDANRYIS